MGHFAVVSGALPSSVWIAEMFEDFGDGKKKGRGAHNEETGGVGGRRLGAKPDEAVGGEDQREGERFSLSWI